METSGRTHGPLAEALASADVDMDRVVRTRELSGGTYNQVTEIGLDDGSRLVLKVSPDAAQPGLAYERELLRAEAEFCRAARPLGDVPVPEVLALRSGPAAGSGGHLLMTAVPGESWFETREQSGAEEQGALRRELGGLVARLHTVTGDGFGYPSGALGPLAGSWHEAFTGMLAALCDDARRYGAELPRPVDEIAARAEAASWALDEVTVPRLVHFDLWEGNLLVERTGAAPRIGGVIDGERMFWGDPLADFVSLALLGDAEEEKDLLDGYRAAGQTAGFDRAARLRMALYRCYLYLIMLVEQEPRGADVPRRAWSRQHVAPALRAALDDLTALA